MPKFMQWSRYKGNGCKEVSMTNSDRLNIIWAVARFVQGSSNVFNNLQVKDLLKWGEGGLCFPCRSKVYKLCSDLILTLPAEDCLKVSMNPACQKFIAVQHCVFTLQVKGYRRVCVNCASDRNLQQLGRVSYECLTPSQPVTVISWGEGLLRVFVNFVRLFFAFHFSPPL